jgi:hypothetical protein
VSNFILQKWLLLAKKFQLGFRIGLDGVCSGPPRSWADLSMLPIVLESLNQAKELVNVSANRGIIKGQVSQNSFRVDDVGGSTGCEEGKRKKEARRSSGGQEAQGNQPKHKKR